MAGKKFKKALESYDPLKRYTVEEACAEALSVARPQVNVAVDQDRVEALPGRIEHRQQARQLALEEAAGPVARRGRLDLADERCRPAVRPALEKEKQQEETLAALDGVA